MRSSSSWAASACNSVRVWSCVVCMLCFVCVCVPDAEKSAAWKKRRDRRAYETIAHIYSIERRVAHLAESPDHHFLEFILLHHNDYHTFKHFSRVLTRDGICFRQGMARVFRLDLHPFSNALHSKCRHAEHGCYKDFAITRKLHIDLPIMGTKGDENLRNRAYQVKTLVQHGRW